MKKVLTFVLAGIMVVSILTLAACGANNTAQTPAAATSDAETPTVETPAAEAPAASGGENSAGGGLNIAVVTSPNGVDDGSFNQNNYEGAVKFSEKYPASTIKAVRETDINNAVTTVENLVADYDVVVSPGFQFADVSKVAVDNPGKYFIIVDSFPNAIDGTEVFDNIMGIQFAEQESGFFAGIAAALETKTGKVAVVNGIAYPSNVNYQFGFESGVAYAKAHLGTNAETISLPSYAGTDVTGADVGGNYIGSFDDEAAGKVLGEALLQEGADIILVAAGGAGNGVFTAVKENGNSFVIGCDVDQYDDGANGGKNIILTSVLKVMDINVERALTAIADGSFKGANVTLGADTDSTGFVKAAGRHQMSDATVKALDDAYKLVKDGTIVPASNFNGNKPDNFPGL